MPSSCCVPLCKQYGYVDKSGRRVSYHKFPTDVHMKKRWIIAIKRDEGPQFSVSGATKVCSDHFVESDFWRSMASGRRLLRDTAVPSVFAFRKVKPPRKPPLQRSACPLPSKKTARKQEEEAPETLRADNENQASPRT